jgi:copper chaperone CopZ
MMANQGPPRLTIFQLRVGAMFCDSCPATIKKKLSAKEWVTSVEAELASKMATVTVNDPKISADDIIKLIASECGLEGATWENDPKKVVPPSSKNVIGFV